MYYRFVFAIAMAIFMGAATLAQTSTPLPTPIPTTTPQAESTEAVADPEATDVLLEPLLDLGVAPPISINLPQDWLLGYDTLFFNEFDGTPATVPIAIYRGPVTGGTGEIVLLWGFDSIVNPFGSTSDNDTLWLDGVRLLRQLIFEAECNIGRFPPDTYSLGGEPVIGVPFSVVDCPTGSDTRGWFVVTRDLGINFAFYIYTDPITAMNGPAEDELQAVLNSIILRVEDITLNPEDLAATQQAFQVTIEAAITQSIASTAVAPPEATDEAP